MAEITTIVNRLLERTQQGKVHWNRSVDERTYTAVIGNNSLALSDYSPTGLRVLRVLDRTGREIETISSKTNPEFEKVLAELFALARSQALEVPGQLDELLKQLESIK